MNSQRQAAGRWQLLPALRLRLAMSGHTVATAATAATEEAFLGDAEECTGIPRRGWSEEVGEPTDLRSQSCGGGSQFTNQFHGGEVFTNIETNGD